MDRALDRIYATIAVENLLQPALEEMIALLGGFAGAVISVPLETGRPPERESLADQAAPAAGVAAAGVAVETIEAWNGPLMAEDPLIPIATRLPAAQVFSLCQKLDVGRFTRGRFYNEVYRASDMLDTLSIRAPAGNRAVSMTIYRPARDDPFQHDDIRRAQSLQPHLRRALMLSQMRPGPTRIERACERRGLTLREAELVVHVMNGAGYTQIAAMQRITRNTLKWRVREIFQKFGVKSRAGLIAACAAA